MLSKNITANDVCELLNELLKVDYSCVESLMNYRVKCNIHIANHPTVQVQQFKTDPFPKVGLLGILNGLFGIDADGMGAIYMVIDDNTRKISSFRTADYIENE